MKKHNTLYAQHGKDFLSQKMHASFYTKKDYTDYITEVRRTTLGCPADFSSLFLTFHF